MEDKMRLSIDAELEVAYGGEHYYPTITIDYVYSPGIAGTYCEPGWPAEVEVIKASVADDGAHPAITPEMVTEWAEKYALSDGGYWLMVEWAED
jgi:hypothetical protein